MARLGHTRVKRAGGRSGGRSIGFRVKQDTRGFNELERRMRKLMAVGDVESALATKATSGVVQGAKVGGVPQSRSAWDNARIWATHRAAGRNPFVYSKPSGVAILKAGANDVVHQRESNMVPAAKKLADHMLATVERNTNAGTGIRPLSPKYAKWKERYYPGRPVLVLTAQLIKSLKPTVVVGAANIAAADAAPQPEPDREGLYG